MLYFCTWKDEDGHHYGVTNKHPKAYFNWKGVHLCDPRTIKVTAQQCRSLLKVHPNYDITCQLVEGDINDWDLFFKLKPKMRDLY